VFGGEEVGVKLTVAETAPPEPVVKAISFAGVDGDEKVYDELSMPDVEPV
jgi:hypothetical protein